MKRIPLTQGKWAIVDDDLYKELSQYKWSLDGSGYPQRPWKTKHGFRPLRMHRHILGLKGREMADHENGNRLDHRLKNLRRCSSSENNRNRGIGKNNTTGYKGVSWHSQRKYFQVYIMKDRHQKYLGRFKTKKEAALAYNEAAKQLHGEFAWLNKIE